MKIFDGSSCINFEWYVSLVIILINLVCLVGFRYLIK